MKITNRKLVENMSSIGDVSRKQLNVKTSYAISYNIGHIDSALKPYNKEVEKLSEKYGKRDKDGKLVHVNLGVTIDKDKMDDYLKELNTLLDIEVDIDVRKIRLDDLKDADGKPVSFSPAELRAINFMLDE